MLAEILSKQYLCLHLRRQISLLVVYVEECVEYVSKFIGQLQRASAKGTECFSSYFCYDLKLRYLFAWNFSLDK